MYNFDTKMLLFRETTGIGCLIALRLDLHEGSANHLTYRIDQKLRRLCRRLGYA
jgi:hypothetical protein